MMHNILDWNKVSLKDKLDILTGYSFSSKQFNKEKGLPLIRIRDLLTHNPVTKYDGEYKDTYLINKGDILIGMDGEFNIVKWKGPKALLNQRVAKIKSKNSMIIDNQFIYYKMFNELKQIESLTPATTVKHLAKKDIQNLNLLLPPIEEQQKIAAILSSVDEAISKTELIIDKNEIVKKGLVQRLFFKGVKNTQFKATLLGEIPHSWEIIQLGEIFENKSEKKQGHLQVLTVTQTAGVIPRDEFSMNIKYDRDSLSSYKKVNIGNFIISLRSFQGGLEKSNYIGLVSPAYTVLNNKVPINIPYFEYLFKSYWFIEQLKSSTIGIRDGKQISYKDFKLIKIPLPSLEEQKRIVEILESVDKKVIFERNRLANLINIKQGLMQQLLTGKVRVPMSENEAVPQ